MNLDGDGWQPGRNGGRLKKNPPGTAPVNPGRPKGSLNRKTIIRKWAECEDDQGLTELDKIVLAQIEKAKKGDTLAYDRIMDGIFGKVRDGLDVSSDREAEFEIDPEELTLAIRNLKKLQATDFISKNEHS